MFVKATLIIFFYLAFSDKFILIRTSNEDDLEPVMLSGSSSENAINKNVPFGETNKQFWDSMYQNSLLNTKTKYNSLSGENVCFTCPIDRNTFDSLFREAAKAANTPDGMAPPRVTITWSSPLSNDRLIFFCRNNSRMTSSPIYLSSDNNEQNSIGGSDSGQIEYSCDNNRLCLTNLKHNYPENYQCMVKSYLLNVKLNVIGDSVKFDYQKEVQVYENQMFTVKCEVPETNPVSNVNAYIDDRELRLTRLEKKTIDNRMTINTYSFEINATRIMNGKRVKCEAKMKDLPAELANSIDLRSHISKDYTLSVYYLPICVFNERVYRTGINRSIVIECPINGSNPDVSSYKMIPPSSRTKIEQIETDMDQLRRVGRFRINPSSPADFGLYECIPRSSAGTAKCDINVELGATPNPPEQCTVQIATVNNKTYAQFSCKPGFNQGGHTSFLTIYEINPGDKHLKLSGRVNIDEGKIDQEVPYITPADQDKYYEFLIMQENNYGNSTSIMLTLGQSEEAKEVEFWSTKNIFIIAVGSGMVLFILFVCVCCCLADLMSNSKSDSACCRCFSASDRLDEDTSTYKKAPLDSDGLGGSSLINQPFQGFNQEINSKNFVSSTYEYYDNASTNLLTENSQFLQSNHFVQKNIYNQQYDDDDGIEEEEEEEEDDSDDHYMNNNDERKVLKRPATANGNHYIHDGHNNYDDDSSEVSSGRKSSQADDQQVFITATNLNLSRKSVYEENMIRNKLSSKVGSASYNLNSNNYSTIDSKNLKLIKTDNGLVYTPLSANVNTLGKKNKSNDALDSKEEMSDGRFQSKDSGYEGLDERREPRHASNKPIISSTYSNVKKVTLGKTPGSDVLLNNPINSNFQNELSMKLKSITSNKEQQIDSGLKVSNNSVNPKTMYQSEPLSNSTATTSLSSASSCTSNSDLTLKKDNFNNNKRFLAPLANADLNDIEQNSQNPSYSLLKTTLNINGTTADQQQPAANGVAGILSKSQTKLNGASHNINYNSYKPPILKPKPRGNNNLQVNGCSQQANKKILNTTFDSVHNHSADPLLNHTSPSTSVTDVSSTNLTPQHCNNMNNQQRNLAQRLAQGAAANATSTQNITPKATTTFSANPIGDGTAQPIYSTTKINTNANDHLVTTTYTNGNGNTLMRTFNNAGGSTYETTTLNRKPIIKKQPADDSRTLERRHVKNSEC